MLDEAYLNRREAAKIFGTFRRETAIFFVVVFYPFRKAKKHWIDVTVIKLPWAPRRAIQRFGQCQLNELGSLGTWDTHAS